MSQISMNHRICLAPVCIAPAAGSPEFWGFCGSCWSAMTRPEKRRIIRQKSKEMKRREPPAPSETGEKTFWNGEPCEASRVRVIVGKSPRSTWWCAGLEGIQRDAVRVECGDRTFYLDNEDGSGWRKVTTGRGSPWASHRSLPVEREVANQ